MLFHIVTYQLGKSVGRDAIYDTEKILRFIIEDLKARQLSHAIQEMSKQHLRGGFGCISPENEKVN